MKLPEFKLERFFAEHEFSAQHLLCASDCESFSVSDLLSLEPDATGRLHDLRLGYTESTGAESLRREIAGLYKSVSAEDILTFCGAQEAIFLVVQAALEARDHVIVHCPCYQSLSQIAIGIGATVDRWEANAADDWRLDLGQLKLMLRPNTRLVIVNLPHNPTGYLMGHEDYAALHDFAAQHELLLLCDEAYRESEYDIRDRLPAGCDMGEHAVSIGVMSKTYGLAGLRVGWIATKNARLLDGLRVLKDYTTICGSGPSELLAEIALRNRQTIVDRNQRIVSANLDLLDAFFKEHPADFAWSRPRAGSIGFPEYLGGDGDTFCQELLGQAGVLLAPGAMFEASTRHFRVGFGRVDFAEGLAAWADFMERYPVG